MLRQASSFSVRSSLGGSHGRLVVCRLACLLLEEAAAAAASGSQKRTSSFSSFRFQSSLGAASSSSSVSTSCRQRRTSGSAAVVNPSVRRHRPHINGKAVAFHISDLIPSSHAHTASAAAAAFMEHAEEETRPGTERKYDSDLIVVLDMDECILHSQFLSNPMTAHVLAHQVQQSRRRNNNGDSNQGSGEVDCIRVQLPNGGDLVHVNLRPGLHDFLDEITSKYETHIFTAAMPIYAKPVLDRLDPENTKFAARWYREHCSWDATRNAYVKNLNALPLPNLARAVLVDNNPLSFLSHPSNGILVSSFYNDPSDQTLQAVTKLIQELEPQSDVRPVLEQKFGLKDALQDLMVNKPSL